MGGIKASRYDWKAMARPNQRIPEGAWDIWLILAGRGFGKTRTGAETIRQWVTSGKCKRVALIAENQLDARQVMVEGVSGLLTISPKEERPQFFSSRQELVWGNGAVAYIYTSEAYERLRGAQFDGAWIDEMAKFSNSQKVWDQLMFGLRLGDHPQVVITTTPRPIPFLDVLLAKPKIVVTTGSSYENIQNLSPNFKRQVLEVYEGTELGRQEIFAEILRVKKHFLWRPEHFQYVEVDMTGGPAKPNPPCILLV